MIVFEKYRKLTVPALLTVLLLLAISPRPAFAYETDSQLWSQFALSGKIQPRVRFAGEIQPRLGDNFGRLSQFVLRGSVGYQATPKISVWIGYGWEPSFLPKFRNEHRIFQDILFENKAGNISLANRTRVEERIRAEGTVVRLRHRVRATIPLDSQKRWLAVCSNEVLFNLNGTQSGFDQDRLYFGGAHTVNRHTRIELGYQASFINSPGNKPNRRLDVLVTSVNYSL